MHRAIWIFVTLCLEAVIASKNLGEITTRIPKRGIHIEANMQKLIYGGLEVPITEFPHIAELVYRGHQFCMGSILNEYTIVTASHCVNKFFKNGVSVENAKVTSKDIKIYVGSAKSTQGTKYDVCKIIMHHKYKRTTYSFDVALIFLKDDIKFSENVKGIKIAPDTHWRIPQSKMSVAGFGKTEIGRPRNTLKAAWLKYVPPELCNRSQTLVGHPEIPADSMFCMVSDHWSGDCFGDSGSGIVWKEYIVGLVVAGLYNECGSSLMPSVYTNLVYFRPWVEEKIQDFIKSSKKCSTDKIKKIKELLSFKQHTKREFCPLG